MPDPHEHWGGGPAYERYMGRWSRPAARAFLRWLAPPAGWRWLDVGCGTGVLAQAILEQADPGAILGVDPSPDFIAYARSRSDDARLRFPICQPGPLGDLFAGSGLAGVRVEALDIETHFADFDDYWTPFLRGQFPGPQYLATLDEAQRIALREQLHARLPVQAEGAIQLVARVWAIRGTTL
jgi:SAM-dependent methyltransferase